MNQREYTFYLPEPGPTVEHVSWRDEDGTNWGWEFTRQFFIKEQCIDKLSCFQNWVYDEFWNFDMM